MAEISLPDFRINTDQPENGIKQLLKISKPTWNSDKIQIHALSGGYSSKIFRVWVEDEPQNAVTIRIPFLTENTKGFKNRLEPKAIAHLSKSGRFPKVNAVFANGYCYNFIKGKPLVDSRNKTGTVTDKMLNAIAIEMAKIHNVDATELFGYKEKSYFTKLMDGISDANFEHELLPSNEIFFKEMQFIDNLRKEINCPVGLCHGDSHCANFLWDEETEKITFIDWELTCVDSQYHDITYFLDSKIYFEPLEEINHKETITMPEDMDNKFLSTYFRERCKLKKEIYSEKNFLQFKESVTKFRLVSMLGITGIVVVFPETLRDVTGNEKLFFEKCLKKYFKYKKDVLGKTGFESLL